MKNWYHPFQVTETWLAPVISLADAKSLFLLYYWMKVVVCYSYCLVGAPVSGLAHLIISRTKVPYLLHSATSRKILITKYDIIETSLAKHNTMFMQRINQCRCQVLTDLKKVLHQTDAIANSLRNWYKRCFLCIYIYFFLYFFFFLWDNNVIVRWNSDERKEFA